MASPAPAPVPLGEPVLALFGRLEEDPKLAGKGLSSAFAASYPDLPAEVSSLPAWDVETRLEILLAFCHGFSHFGILAQCVLQFPMILQVLPVHVYRYR